MIVVPVNIIIVTLFRKAKLKSRGILPRKTDHVAKQQYWRRVKMIENIELPDEDRVERISSYFNVNQEAQKSQREMISKEKKTL